MSIISISQMKKLRPQVTQLMAELEFDPGLMFLLTSLGCLPFYSASCVPGPIWGPLPVCSIILMAALHTGLYYSSPGIEGGSTALCGEVGWRGCSSELIWNLAGFQVGSMRVPGNGGQVAGMKRGGRQGGRESPRSTLFRLCGLARISLPDSLLRLLLLCAT